MGARKFAVYFLLFELLTKVSFSFLQFLSFSDSWICFFYAIVSMIADLMMFFLQPFDAADVASEREFLDSMRLWCDGRLWLLSVPFATFGLAAAYMNGDVNAQCAVKALSKGSIGILSACTVASS